jgi:hypothetical protein
VAVPNINGQIETVDLQSVQIELEFNANTDIRLLLYTKANPNSPQVITSDPATLTAANFQDINTRFLIHGWNNDAGSNFNTLIRTALLNAYDVNVIVVDWGIGAQTLNYISARNRVLEVGPFVGRYINFLVSNNFLTSYEKVNIIGHSLGAHAAGIAGKYTAQKVAVIYGLDPSGPLFSERKPNERLDRNDAVTTVALHTSGGRLGYYKPIAKIDFYANNGSIQPGCILDLTGVCAHSRAYEYFTEAITSTAFVAKKCISFSQAKRMTCAGTPLNFIGETTTMNGDGIYNFKTKSSSPYAMG